MKERLIILVIAISIFTLSYGIYSREKQTLTQEIKQLKAKFEKVSTLAQQYRALSEMEKKKGPPLKSGLLSYIQTSSKAIGISNNIGSIKPLPGDSEVVDVIYQKLNLKQIIDIFVKVDSISNLRIRSFSVNKRFDNPGYADLNMQIEKIR